MPRGKRRAAARRFAASLDPEDDRLAETAAITLPSATGVVVELRRFSDVRPSFRETGDRLGISDDAARKRYQRPPLVFVASLGLE